MISGQLKISYNGKTPKQMKAAWDKFVSRTLPDIISRECVNFFKDRFRLAYWIDSSPKAWPKRDPDLRKGGALLVDSGKLRNSIREVSRSSREIVFGSDIPYAQAHNEGFDGTVTVPGHTRKNVTVRMRVTFSDLKSKAMKSRKKKVIIGDVEVKSHSRKMHIPRRQFMGASEFLNRRINMVIEFELKKLFS